MKWEECNMAKNTLSESVEINGVRITPEILGFIKKTQDFDGEVIAGCLEAIRIILFYAIKQSIENDAFDKIQNSTIETINFLEDLKVFQH